MGADEAPKPEIEGAILAARYHDVRVLLVGREDVIEPAMRQYSPVSNLPVEIVHASEAIGMNEHAVQAVRSKRDSSMRVGIRLVKEGKADGFVSAGNTGAAMATAKMTLGALPGVDRPALAAVFPNALGTASIMLDVGANVDCKPHNLQQFAIMGEAYYRSIFAGKPNADKPRVGLLSVGSEDIKGNELTRESFGLLKDLSMNFIGNVEGRDLYNGRVDVIVCDGFVGNVALKVSEGLVATVRDILKDSMKQTVTRQVGYFLSRNAFGDFKKRLDYSEYGGAPLLGVKGPILVGHGSSNGIAIKNAIRAAAEFVRSGVNQTIQDNIRQAGERLEAARRDNVAAAE